MDVGEVLVGIAASAWILVCNKTRVNLAKHEEELSTQRIVGLFISHYLILCKLFLSNMCHFKN